MHIFKQKIFEILSNNSKSVISVFFSFRLFNIYLCDAGFRSKYENFQIEYINPGVEKILNWFRPGHSLFNLYPTFHSINLVLNFINSVENILNLFILVTIFNFFAFAYTIILYLYTTSKLVLFLLFNIFYFH